MEAEQVAALNRLDGLIDVEEGDLIQRLVHGNASRAPGDRDQSSVSQLGQYVPDDDGIGIDAARKELAGYLVFILKHIHTGKDMQRHCEPA